MARAAGSIPPAARAAHRRPATPSLSSRHGTNPARPCAALLPRLPASADDAAAPSPGVATCDPLRADAARRCPAIPRPGASCPRDRRAAPRKSARNVAGRGCRARRPGNGATTAGGQSPHRCHRACRETRLLRRDCAARTGPWPRCRLRPMPAARAAAAGTGADLSAPKAGRPQTLRATTQRSLLEPACPPRTAAILPAARAGLPNRDPIPPAAFRAR